MKTQEILAFAIIILVAIVCAGFIGKTTISADGISMERPMTAGAFLITIILGLIESN